MLDINKSNIDFVITWVDDMDPIWKSKKEAYFNNKLNTGNTVARYRDWDLLKYWFRGVEKNAPWVRNIFFVTDDQKPKWLNLDHPKLIWMKHTDFIPNEYLPTFNANAIEWNLYRIYGLSEQFVYFNDDMFLINQVSPTDFFVEGKPCDLPKIGMLYAQGFFEHMLFNNMELLSRNFSFIDSLNQNMNKWIKKQKLFDILKILACGNNHQIPYIKSYHLHVPYLKNTFEQIWEKEFDILNDTCNHKFRTKQDVTTWCARDWQILSGDFYPSRAIGRMFHTSSIKNNSELVNYLKGRKGKVICLNDSESESNFESHKSILASEFSLLFPEKSSFEL